MTKRAERDWEDARGIVANADDLGAVVAAVREIRAEAFEEAARYVAKLDLYEAIEMRAHFQNKAKRARSGR